MLMTGKEYLESIRDGRVLYIGSERVEDQTRHPGFAQAARTYSALYDLKSDSSMRDLMTFEEGGERYNMYYLQPRAIVGNDCVRAVLAARDMAAECRRAAALDRTHDLHLVEADVPGIGSAPRRPVVAEDIRDLQRWTGHGRALLRRRLVFPALLGLLARLRQQVERALDAGDHAGGDAGGSHPSLWINDDWLLPVHA